jgi:hypothetical protein
MDTDMIRMQATLSAMRVSVEFASIKTARNAESIFGDILQFSGHP